MNFFPQNSAHSAKSLREFEAALSIERLQLSLLLSSLDRHSSRACVPLKGPLARRVHAVAESDGWSSTKINFC